MLEDIPSLNLDVVANDSALKKTSQPNEKEGKKTSKPCSKSHKGRQYSKTPKFNYNYKVSKTSYFITEKGFFNL